MRRFIACCGLLGLILALVWSGMTRGVSAQRPQAGEVAVTFRVAVPAETPAGDAIYVTGDFQGWDPSATPLTRSGNTASITLMLTPGNIAYKYTRGTFGKVEKGSNGEELSNRTATITGSTTLNDTVARWADITPGSGATATPTGGYDVRAQLVALPSQALGIAKQFYIYTPPDYSQNTAQRYPTLYLFRGHEREWINKNEDGSRGSTNVIDVYEQLLAAGQVGPMILVFPGIASDDNAVSGFLTNFLRPDLAAKPGVGTGKYHDYLINELIPYVDRHYRTVADHTGRGVDGFSLGGFMSAKIAAQHPELFRTAGAFDGTYLYANATCDGIGNDSLWNNPSNNGLLDPPFGAYPHDGAYAALNNAPNLVCNATPSSVQSVQWLIQYGAASCEPTCSNYLRGTHFVMQLNQKGAQNSMAQPVIEGGHTWHNADEHLRQTLPLHWATLRAALQTPTATRTATMTASATATGVTTTATMTGSATGTTSATPTGSATATGTATGTATIPYAPTCMPNPCIPCPITPIPAVVPQCLPTPIPTTPHAYLPVIVR